MGTCCRVAPITEMSLRSHLWTGLGRRRAAERRSGWLSCPGRSASRLNLVSQWPIAAPDRGAVDTGRSVPPAGPHQGLPQSSKITHRDDLPLGDPPPPSATPDPGAIPPVAGATRRRRSPAALVAGQAGPLILVPYPLWRERRGGTGPPLRW